MEKSHVYEEPWEVDGRLAELELTQAILLESAAKGLDARNRCTPFDPPAFPALSQWAYTHRGLRESLVPAGWTADDTGGFSTVVSPSGRIAMTVASGAGRTGRPGLPPPSTKHRRGPMTLAAIQRNQLVIPGMASATPDAPRRITWVLLFQNERDQVQLELSCPHDIDEAGRVVGWSERILLNPLHAEPTISFFDDGEVGDDEIDVPVERL